MKPLLLFAPGAGAPSTHLWMQQWKERLKTIGDVEIFDYGYTRERRKRPDPLPKLVATHRKALSQARERHPAGSTILIGKSMGGRIGCHVSLTEKVDGLICLGYPLCAMGNRAKLRDEVLLALTTPILFSPRSTLFSKTVLPAALVGIGFSIASFSACKRWPPWATAICIRKRSMATLLPPLKS